MRDCPLLEGGGRNLGLIVSVAVRERIRMRDSSAADLRIGIEIGANGYLGDVERAAIQANGALGPFVSLAGATRQTPRAAHAAAVVGDRVYVLGGVDDSGPLDSVESATMYGVVSLTAFAPIAGVSLAAPRGHLTCMAIDNQLYSIGGADAGGGLSSMEQAPLN